MTKRTRGKHIRDRQRRDRKRRPRKTMRKKTMRKKTMRKKTSAKQMRLRSNKKIKRSVRIHRTRKMNGGWPGCCGDKNEVIELPKQRPREVLCDECLTMNKKPVKLMFNKKYSFCPCSGCERELGPDEGNLVEYTDGVGRIKLFKLSS